MSVAIRPMSEEDVAAIVALSLAAWLPVFESFGRILGPEIYGKIYPDWRASQAKLVEDVCRDGEKYSIYVADSDGAVVGFLAYTLDDNEKTGEIYLLAVDPDYQNLGIGTALNRFALARMVGAGMKLAFVGTGGDPAHAPARRSYEKAGFTALPNVQYYKDLP